MHHLGAERLSRVGFQPRVFRQTRKDSTVMETIKKERQLAAQDSAMTSPSWISWNLVTSEYFLIRLRENISPFMRL